MGRIMGNPHELRVVNVRLVKEPSLYSAEPITSPEDALKLISKELALYDREVFSVLNLKTSGQVISWNICSIGDLNSACASPREVMKTALLSNAGGIIVIHNHPGSDIRTGVHPSEEDRAVTKRMMEACSVIGVNFIDHIIVGTGENNMYSFRKEGELDMLRPATRDWER